MVEISAKIVITGIVCLTIIYVSLIACDHDGEAIGALIIGAISLAIGVVIPSPKVDNKSGVLRW